jgi:hypothetical protein
MTAMAKLQWMTESSLGRKTKYGKSTGDGGADEVTSSSVPARLAVMARVELMLTEVSS